MDYKGIYFLAGTAEKKEVLLCFRNEEIYLQNSNDKISISKSDFKVESVIPGNRVIINFKGHLEFDYSKELIKKLEQAGFLKKHFAFKLETSFMKTILFTLMMISLVFGIYKYLLGPTSEYIAKILPDTLLMKIDTLTLKNIDNLLLSKSKLSLKRQTEIKTKFDKLTDGKYKLLFREGGSIGENAFALAYEHIIVTDELIDLLRKDEYILSILFHEAGHIENKDVATALVKDSFFVVAAIFILGDITGATSSLTNGIIGAGASRFLREQEQRADLYAVDLLKKKNISIKCFAESMKLLQANKKKSKFQFDIFSTHPKMQERISKINKIESIKKDCL